MEPIGGKIFIGTTERCSDPGILLRTHWQASLQLQLGMNAHGLPQSLDLCLFDLDSALALCATLKIMDRQRLSPQHKFSSVGARKPFVQTQNRKSELTNRFLAGEEFF
ncbi:hypothetical protein OAG29_00120 [Planctomycetaceae bacterium]|jgi:hypothetical protein|nr:hypothetical protein [Planctomycetaceae bacterium]